MYFFEVYAEQLAKYGLPYIFETSSHAIAVYPIDKDGCYCEVLDFHGGGRLSTVINPNQSYAYGELVDEFEWDWTLNDKQLITYHEWKIVVTLSPTFLENIKKEIEKLQKQIYDDCFLSTAKIDSMPAMYDNYFPFGNESDKPENVTIKMPEQPKDYRYEVIWNTGDGKPVLDKDLVCKNVCVSLLNGHSFGCPYYKG